MILAKICYQGSRHVDAIGSAFTKTKILVIFVVVIAMLTCDNSYAQPYSGND